MIHRMKISFMRSHQICVFILSFWKIYQVCRLLTQWAIESRLCVCISKHKWETKYFWLHTNTSITLTTMTTTTPSKRLLVQRKWSMSHWFIILSFVRIITTWTENTTFQISISNYFYWVLNLIWIKIKIIINIYNNL